MTDDQTNRARTKSSSPLLSGEVGRAVVSLVVLLTLPCAAKIQLLAEEAQVRPALSEASLGELRREINPRGIVGSLVVGGADTPDVAFDEFFKLAAREKARVVVIYFDAKAQASENSRRLIAGWQSSGAPEMQLLSVRSREAANDSAVIKAIDNATGVWLEVGDVERFHQIVNRSDFEKSLRALIRHGKVIGTSAGGCASNLLPRNFIKATEDVPHGSVRFQIDPDAALVMRGRRIRSVGDGETRITIPASRARPARQVILTDGKGMVDLPALQRSAVERLAGFPPKQPGSPVVEDGTLIIIGGGGIPKGLIEQFVEFSGGDKSRIVILPTAIPDPIPERSGFAEMLKQLGAKKVTVLPGRTREVVESDEYLEALRNATGLWFGGGRQWRFVDAYLDTKAEALMHDVLRRGGVIAGSSAGASIQAEYMARGNPLGNLDIMAEGYERGLGFLKGAAIDQHFTQRGRQRDMTQLVDKYPQLLGIGIDETTAIVVQKSIAKVVGKHDVCFYDRKKPKQEGKADYEIVRDGGSYDLVKRRIIDPGAPKEKPKPKDAEPKSNGKTDSAEEAADLPRLAAMALRRSTAFFREQVSTEGGYLWRYSADLAKREGEGKADHQTVWVQPPGTPAVGIALLEAHQMTEERYLLEAARAAGMCLVRGQLQSGGWDYRIYFDAERRHKNSYRVDQSGKNGRNVTTLDDNTTQTAIRLLMRLDKQLGFEDKQIHQAAGYALTSLLKAQYPNGAWPQRYSQFPDPAAFPVKKASYPESWTRTYPKKKYNTFYTFNDNAIADIVEVMFEAARVYGNKKYAQAAERAGGFILLAQMPDPQPAWAQQYDINMQPAWARKFEPPAITGGESRGVLRTLMNVYAETGDRKYFEPIPRALDYFRRCKLTNGRLARFYELRTNRPLYFTRKYELTYDDTDLPTHYGFTVGNWVEKVAANYERIKDMSPEQIKSRRKPKMLRLTPELENQVREIVAAMDDRGAWVESGGLKYHGDDDATNKIIACRTFIQNIGILSRYLACAR
jgi:cyanophycinase